MPKKQNQPNGNQRRSFIKKAGVGALGASIAPHLALGVEGQPIGENELLQKRNAPKSFSRKYNGDYTGEYLDKIAFPIGGMGAGMFCLEGTGAISHMSIRHRPELYHQPNMFAAIAIKGRENGAKVLEGPVPSWKMFGPRGTGNGAHGANYGLPRFEKATFKTRFPFAEILLFDSDIPLIAQVTGWSPFIPGEEDYSSLPVGALEYTFKNNSSETIEAVFSYNARNFVLMDKHKGGVKPLKNGFELYQESSDEQPFGESHFAIFTDEKDTVVDHCWFRGGWFDPLTIVWNTIKEGKLKDTKPVEENAPGASLFVAFKLNPGEEKTIKVKMAWYVPKADLHFGEMVKEAACEDAANCCSPEIPASIDYVPWYASKFDSIDTITSYWRQNYEDFKKKSNLFADAFYGSTLPDEVIEAVAANLTILKSPTVMREVEGRLWSWEGCSDDWGCCHGSCTHVWNYAQAIPHLFPKLERTLRDIEFCASQNLEGHQTFRANLPISPTKHDFHAASDGQLGGIMKVHREWRISGDNAWIAKMYPLVKASMDYCIKTWDPNGKGILEEPHHNTYDIEFWGPDGMCTSFYLGALLAIAKMGKYLEKDISRYTSLYKKGRKFMESQLYNGEYFIQKIQWEGLVAENPVKAQSFHTQYSEEALAILKEEGPKYQYGDGCLSDGILGGWIARMCGLEDPVDSNLTRNHLMAVHKYNLKNDLTDHINPQRPTYALGHEGGLLLCSWPKGGKLSLPFVYSNEVWTGIEYQVASHLMILGKVKEGLEIVRACRDRYDGRVRNPFNEYECGSWYARAMASYGMLEGLTGVRYDAVERTLYVDSQIGDFKGFIATENGFGSVILNGEIPSLQVVYGEIPVDRAVVSGKEVTIRKV